MLGLATSSAHPGLDPDNLLLLQALTSRGIAARPVVWTDPASIEDITACIIRATWDYHTQREAFLQWAERVESRMPLWNPAATLRWNTDKIYLQTLESRGIRIVPTRWVDRGSAPPLSEVGDWTEMVVKPRISAGAVQTHRLSGKAVAAFQPQFEALVAEHDVMIQPYMTTVETSGEVSLVYLQGEFSHAVQKTPSAGDFRVQEHLGGTARRIDPPPGDIAFGSAVLQAADGPFLYARVDVVYDEARRPHLSELEVSEPSLYLLHAPEAADRLAEIIGRLL